jgi:hypothetical protein
VLRSHEPILVQYQSSDRYESSTPYKDAAHSALYFQVTSGFGLGFPPLNAET